MNSYFLELDTVTKEFGKVKAVDGLSFHIKKGEIFALLGPNGAGKTTAVRMLLGIIRPDAGHIRYCMDGVSIAAPLSSEFGYLPEDRGLYKDLPIKKTLTYLGVLHGMSREDAVRSVAQWLEKVGLTDRANDKLETLSKGNQQKVQFISAILHNPAFAVLDEPFSGLDPVNQDFFLQIVHNLRDSGTTVLLSAHQMNLVERLADRMLLINRGKEVLQGTIQQIKDQARSSHKIVLTVDSNADLSFLRDLPSVIDVEREPNGGFAFFLRKGENINNFLAAVSSKAPITAIHSEQISLHEIFVQSVRTDEGVQ